MIKKELGLDYAIRKTNNNGHWIIPMIIRHENRFSWEDGKLHLQHYEIRDLELQAYSLRGSYLVNMRFVDCGFTKLSFNNSDLNGTRFLDCGLSRCEFDKVKMFKMDFVNVDLSISRIIKSNLYGSQITDCKLRGTTFINCNLHDTKFYGCDLSDASFYGCNFMGASFYNCKFLSSKFVNCNFEGAKFIGGDLILTEIKDCIFSGSEFQACKVRTIYFQGSDLRNTIFSSINIESCDFRNTIINKVIFKNCILLGPNIFDCPDLDSDASDDNSSLIKSKSKYLIFNSNDLNIPRGFIRNVCERVNGYDSTSDDDRRSLNQSRWHTSLEIHSLGGWAIHLHPSGYKLAEKLGNFVASSLLLGNGFVNYLYEKRNFNVQQYTWRYL